MLNSYRTPLRMLVNAIITFYEIYELIFILLCTQFLPLLLDL